MTRRLLLLAAVLAAHAAPASAATYRETIAATPGVVAHWPLDEATAPVVDVVGARSATPTRTYVLGRPAGIDAGGSSLALSGSGAASFASSTSLNPAGSVSLEAWVAPTAGTTASDRYVLSKGTMSSGYHLLVAAGGLPALRVNGTRITGPALRAGGWHHLVGVLHGATMSLYVNGQLVASGAGPAAPTATSGSLRIGRYSNSGSGYFQGGLDEVALYASGLDAGTVAAHFAAGADLTPPRVAFAAPPADQSDGTIAFTGSKGGLTYTCALGDDVPEPCAGTYAYELLRDGAHTLTVHATDRWGTTTSTAHTWQVALPAAESAAPVTTLTETPPALTNATTARFSWTGSKPRLTFTCRLDGGPWVACVSGVTPGGLSEGRHVLEVRATDRWGVVEETPRSFAWTIDVTAPETFVLAAKATRSDAGSAVLGSEQGATFECRAADGPWGPCAASFPLPRLSVAGQLVVRAVDAAGNADPSPASIVLSPADLTAPIAFSGGDAAFEVGGNRSVAGLRCRIDDGAEAACPWPLRFTGLSYGEHRLVVSDPDLPGVVFPTITWTNPLPSPQIVGSQFPAVLQLGSPRRQASLAASRLPRLLFQSNSAGTARVTLRRGSTTLRRWSAPVVEGSNLVRLPRAAWKRLRPGRYRLVVAVGNAAGASAPLTLRFDAVRTSRR